MSQEERRVDSQEETVIVSSDIGAGVQASLLEQELVENDSQWEGLNQQNQELETVATLCDEPIIWPIEFGKNNDIGQVKRLEKYLITERWENLTIDGTYDQADFEAVKRFQLEFKEDILDPWGLTAPTWFVFRTTVQKINETACN